MQTKQLINQDYMECQIAPGTSDPTSKAAAKASFLLGSDWLGDYTVGFQRLSVRDFAPGTKVNLRYNKQLSITTVIV